MSRILSRMGGGMGMGRPNRGGGGAAPVTINAPVLTLVDGAVNPPTYGIALDATVFIGDTIRLEYGTSAVFAGSSTEDHVLTSDDVLLGEIAFTAFASLAATTHYYWRLRVVRGATLSAWSNTLDATTPASAPTWINISTPTPQTNSSTTHTFSNVAFGTGKAVILLRAGQNPSVSMVPSGGGATTNFTSVATGDSVKVFQANGVAAGNYDITIATTANETPMSMTVATGTGLANAVSDISEYAGGYPGNDIAGSSTLIVPVGGLGIAIAWVLGNTTGSWLTGGVEIGEVTDSGNVLTHSAATYTGTNTPTWRLDGGSNYSTLAAAAWAAA